MSQKSPASDGSNAGFARLVGCEQQIAVDRGAVHRRGPQHERRDVFGRQRQHQVRVDELALVPHPFGVVEVRERRAVGRAGQVNVQAPSRCGMPSSHSRSRAAAAERGHQPRQFRVDRAAVVALVVVLGDHLPVRRDRIGQPHAHHQGVEWITAHPVRHRTQRVDNSSCLQIFSEPEESAPRRGAQCP